MHQMYVEQVGFIAAHCLQVCVHASLNINYLVQTGGSYIYCVLCMFWTSEASLSQQPTRDKH